MTTLNSANTFGNAAGSTTPGTLESTTNNISGHKWNKNDWFIDNIAEGFDKGATKMMRQLEKARKKLSKKPDNPSVLAEFQAKLSEYTLFRNAQSSTVKAFKDIDAAIIQNFR